MAHPTSEWSRVGNSYYRKIQLYDAIFDPDLELEHCVLAQAPFAGAIALHRTDGNQLRTFRASKEVRSGIDIYSCSGTLIRTIHWDQGHIVALGWSDEEQLVVVTTDGNVRCYEDLQGDFRQFSLGRDATKIGVDSCRFWATGFVARLRNNALITVPSLTEPRPRTLAAPPPDAEVHAWSLIPPARYAGTSRSQAVEVLLAADSTLYAVDATAAEDRQLTDGPFRYVRVSPNGKYVALYTDNGKVWVVSSDLQQRFSEYDVRARTRPLEVQWCGDDAVVLAWEDEVHLVGPNGAALKFYYESRLHLLPDVDGVRIITNDVCEFLQKVPDDTEEVFRVGSTAPASVLLDAIEQLEKGSPKADDNIQLIRSNLPDAIDTCVRAAGEEYGPRWQRELLKAASFGKSVLDLYNSDAFVEMCETLRVLNAVRTYQIGMPITFQQWHHLKPARLIQRLVHRREYLLAIRISEYLRLPTDRIYSHWAAQKVRHSRGDEDSVCQVVVERLADRPGISFEAIARAAHDEGRTHLATRLLDHEPRAGKQVPLLLSMGEPETALDKALSSGDTDLVLFVLLQLKNKLPLASFFRLLAHRPAAAALVESSAASHDVDLLKDFYYQDDRPIDSSDLIVSSALDQSTTRDAAEKLQLAQKSLTESKDPAATFQQKALRDAQQLIKFQEGLSGDLEDAAYVRDGPSLYVTLDLLLRNGHAKKAAKLQADFHVSEVTFHWIRLRALVAARRWADLEELSKARRSSIDWEAYVHAILTAGNPRVAGIFVAKCTGLTPLQRSELWRRCGLPVEAARELAKSKDVNGLEKLRGQTGSDQAAQLEIERLLSQLKLRR